MLGFIKALPIFIIIAGIAWGGHNWIVGKLETRIDQQQMQIDVLNQQNVSLQAAAEQNEATIRNMEARAQEQVKQITSLSNSAAEWENQARDYMNIFSNHDFTKLARLKPGMIEDRANNATREVFDSVEADSREIEDLNEQYN